ncbi:MAG: COX15/CtaA family protein [Acidimicrobiales bacterium]
MQIPRVGPRAFLRLAKSALVLVVLNIVTGGAVRLTDSGLGCPDWPTCSKRSLTPALSFHPAVEFGNRMVVVVLCVVAAAAVVTAVARRPRRRDLVWLSVGLVGGVIGEAVLGGIVVYSKLNPYAVMTHFLVGMALLSVATVLALRAGRAPGPAVARVGRAERRLAAAMVGVLAVAVAAGTATTGAGPHAGGKGAVRLPVALSDMARTHSGTVLVLGAFVLAELYLLYRSGAPDAVQERGRLLLAAMVAQGVIGYTQYFSHLPPLLVGIHLFGATVVWSAALWFVDGLWHHAPEVSPDLVTDVAPVTPATTALPGERPVGAR